MQNLINDKSAAEILGIAIQTLSNWRFHRKGPRYLKIGSSIRYRRLRVAISELEMALNSGSKGKKDELA